MAETLSSETATTPRTHFDDLLRLCHWPLIWCAGCGNGIVLQAMLRAIRKLGLRQDDVCLVSGIGCSSRIPGYADFNTVHTTHGRPIAFATGIKIAKPDLNVIVITGDGDCAAIGGNHFIHACRRNLDLTVILINNNIYGMTGGQGSPTTGFGKKSTTTPYGNVDNPMDLSIIAVTCGASYVARTTTYHVAQLERFIRRGIENKGLSLIEVVAACPTSYGRPNKEGDGAAMMLWQKEHAIPIAKAKTLPPEELLDKVTIGVFIDKPRPEWRSEYQKLIDRLAPEISEVDRR